MVEGDGAVGVASIDEATDDGIPEEDIGGGIGMGGEDGKGIIDMIEGGVEGEEVGREEEVEMEVGSDHGSVDGFEGFEGLALFEEGNAGGGMERVVKI